MNLIIANSAQISFAISRALNCTDRTECGAYTNDTRSIVITTVDPGLIAPFPPQAYANGSDFIKELPYLRKDYVFGLRPYFENGKLKQTPEDKEAVLKLKALMDEAAEVVFASNGGSEAQALFSMICKYLKYGRHTSRMWLTTLNNRAISLAYRRRESGRVITRIARSGLVNLGMDFLFNTNVEQALAEAYGKKTFPMRRMDIAALWLLCNNYDQRKVKRPEVSTYTFKVTGEWDGELVELAPTGIWHNAEKAEAVHQRLMERMDKTYVAEVIGTTDHCNHYGRPFNMASLQQFALSELGFMPSRTMEVADMLFEKGLISSPRTCTEWLPGYCNKQILNRHFSEKLNRHICEETIV